MSRAFQTIAFSIGVWLLPSFVAAQQPQDFNPSGYFIPIQSERNQSRVRWILFSDYHAREEAGPLYVELRIGTTKRWATFRQASLAIDGQDVRFTTEAHNGTSYRFVGQLLPTDTERLNHSFSSDDINSRPALRGTLKTFRGSRLIRTEELAYYYTDGD